MRFRFWVSAAVCASMVACTGTENPPGDEESKPAVPIETAKSTDRVAIKPSGVSGGLPQYRRYRAIIVRDGRSVVELIRNKQIPELRKLFTKEFARALSESATLEFCNSLAEVLRADRRGESVVNGAYRAEYEGAGVRLLINVALDPRGLVSGILARPAHDDAPAETTSSVAMFLPVNGAWFVYWGGVTERQNYHVAARSQQHALDLVVWKSGSTHGGTADENSAYYAFGRSVLATHGGEVVAVHDGLPDNTPTVETDEKNPVGNHVVIRIGVGEYLVFAHLQRGSVAVKQGQRVTAGERIGRVGNSGNTSEPHLHVHLQDRVELSPDAVGIRMVFADYKANGEAVEKGSPLQEQFVESTRVIEDPVVVLVGNGFVEVDGKRIGSTEALLGKSSVALADAVAATKKGKAALVVRGASDTNPMMVNRAVKAARRAGFERVWFEITE